MGVYHAMRSPSGAKRWTSCTASPEAQRGRHSPTSEASRQGTTGHQIGEECLISGADPMTYVGRTLCFLDDRREVWEDDLLGIETTINTVVVSQELAEAAVKYVNYCRARVEVTGAQMFVEQAVPIDHITGEEGATGMSDCILVYGETIEVIDAKFGRAKVYAYDVLEEATLDMITGEAVPPRLQMNLQASMYALGVIRKYAALGPFTKIKVVIVQPFLNSVSEYECDVEELLELAEWLKQRAHDTYHNPEFVPSADNCFFCTARFDCHARNKESLSSALDGFDDVETARPKPITIPTLGQLYSKVDFIRKWCDDVEQLVLGNLLKGAPVINGEGKKYTLVVGKKNNKEWDNPDEVEALMKQMKIKPDVMYSRKLVTPTQAEALAEKLGKRKAKDEPKKPIGKIKWRDLSARITQKEGKPVIALATDPRPRYNIPTEGFDTI